VALTTESAGADRSWSATEYRWHSEYGPSHRPLWRAYHRALQNLVLGAISGIAIIIAVVAAVTVLRRRGRITWLQVALGIGVGLLGAFLVLTSTIDLIPDEPEDYLERIVVIAVTVVAVVGTWYRIARA
jgi:zinc transporter ZupT